MHSFAALMRPSFIHWIKNSTAAKRYIAIAFIVSLGYYALEHINGRAQMADFRVYYDAANAFIHNQSVYGVAFGVSSGFYKYSPIAVFPFIPLALLPYSIASALFYLILTLAFIGWTLRLYYDLQHDQASSTWHQTGWILAFTSIFLLDHIERELHLGNINLFLLIASYITYRLLLQNKQIQAGIIYGFILLFKPHFIILLPYIIWKKKWQTLATTVASVLVGFGLPALFKGWEGNALLLQQWMDTMRLHNVSLENSPNTIYGIVNRYLLNFQGGAGLVIILLIVVVIFFLGYIIYNRKKENNESIRYVEFFFLVAAIPNLTHTDTEHFLWTWPLIAYILLRLGQAKIKQHGLILLLLVAAFIPYCLNSPDIVGRTLRDLFDEKGLLGLANLLLIGIAIYFSLTPPGTEENRS